MTTRYSLPSFREPGRLVRNSKCGSCCRDMTSERVLCAKPWQRLAAEGFVEQRAQRGVRAPELTFEELQDLSATRQIVESEAIRLAALHGNHAWRDNVVASFSLYERDIRQHGEASSVRLGNPHTGQTKDFSHIRILTGKVFRVADQSMFDCSV
jgi:hypothetical protein